MDDRRRFEPPSVTLAEPFWEATRQQRLVLPWCDSCERPHWYPRRRCPHCGARQHSWHPATGVGTLVATSRQHRPGWPGLVDAVPYDVGLVDWDEGVRMLVTILGDPEVAQVPVPGSQVAVAWEPLSDGRHLPCVRLAAMHRDADEAR